jgi:GTP pyrophosphokinase
VPLNYELRSGDQVEIITSAIKTNNKLARLCNYFKRKKIKCNVLNENTKKTAEDGEEI